VAAGTACHLRLESERDAAWSGQVVRIAPAANQATRTFSLFVEVDNTRQKQPLMPGTFVRAQIDGPVWRDVLVIPRGIIQEGHVFIYERGVAQRRAVTIRRHLLDQAVVRGLNPGETVITSNLDALFDGAPVRIQEGETLVAQPTTKPAAPAGETPVQAPAKSSAARGS